MIEAPLPDNERERIAELGEYGILDSPEEQDFDDLTAIAASICETPIALISFVDTNRQWFKSRVGLDATETPRSVAFCSHSILQPDEVMVIADAFLDERFADNPLVTGAPGVRFYAGAPLLTPQGHALGTMCVIDQQPRELSSSQVEALRALARQTVAQLQLRRANASLRQIAACLTRTNAELAEFTSIASHDLQEPLRKMVAFSDLLRRDLGEDLNDQAQEDLVHMTDAAERMQRLVHDLLQLSRAGSSELNLHEVDLAACAHEALEALSLLVQETGARITIERLPKVQGDARLLTQLFQNLIANALKFTLADTPEVNISMVEIEGGLAVEVRDNGIGIEAKRTEKIFSPFKRLHGRGRYKGTGIGLAIVKKAIDRHSGRIWVEPDPSGGSRFRFSLPGLESDPRAEAA